MQDSSDRVGDRGLGFFHLHVLNWRALSSTRVPCAGLQFGVGLTLGVVVCGINTWKWKTAVVPREVEEGYLATRQTHHTIGPSEANRSEPSPALPLP